jgi:hypothetical protein
MRQQHPKASEVLDVLTKDDAHSIDIAHTKLPLEIEVLLAYGQALLETETGAVEQCTANRSTPIMRSSSAATSRLLRTTGTFRF